MRDVSGRVWGGVRVATEHVGWGQVSAEHL